MHPLLKRLLVATRLVRDGRVREATAAIRVALEGAVESEGPVDLEEAPPPVRAPVVEPEAAPAAPPPPPSPDESSPARFGEGSFATTSGTRRYRLYEPPRGDGRRLPLVVMLHGCKQDPDDFATGTRMNDIAEQQGFVVLYPAQDARSNLQRCWNWFLPTDQRRGLGEPAVLAAMTQHVAATHGVDPSRIYVAGLSAGGAMAAILAREYADVYAAAGIHSGLPAGAAHDVASAFAVMRTGVPSAWVAATASADRRRAVPTIVFQGDADATVAAGNADALVRAVLEAEGGRAIVAEHVPASEDEQDRRATTRMRWRDAADPQGPALCELWLVHGAPHAWSGGDAAGSFTDPEGPDASREMVRFFLEHARAGASSAAID